MRHIFTFSVLAVAAMAQEESDLFDNLFTEGNNWFTATMFSKVVNSNPDKSVVLSAFSVLTPLAQLSLASEGASHDELLRAIGLPNDNITKSVFSRLNNRLRNVKGIDLRSVSKIYVAENYELNSEFSAVTRDVFNSEVENIDFTKSTETAKEINSWVEEQTNHRIKDLVSADDLSVDTRSILVNAIYFKGKWDNSFKKENTTEEDFHVSKDKSVKVRMMHQRAKLRYAYSDELKAQLLELPYEGHEAFFIVILPMQVDGIAALLEKLTNPYALELAMLQMRTFDVIVSLPKFTIETETDLKSVLENVGVKRIFNTTEAQLTRLLRSDEIMYVSKATQKAFIEVNEEGAEVSGGNESEGTESRYDYEPEMSATFCADHAFVYVLREQRNIIFNGVFIS